MRLENPHGLIDLTAAHRLENQLMLIIRLLACEPAW